MMIAVHIGSRRNRAWTWAAAVALIGGCTTLGPMPATTGISSVPVGRPGGEVGFGVVPGYYLSAGTVQSPEGAGLKQASLLLEPDRLIHVPGVVVGARYVGSAQEGGYLEPLLGYRVHLDDDQRFAAMGIAYMTHASGSREGADYKATRGGAEIGFDVRATPKTSGFELHASGALALTGLSASGHYCLDVMNQYGETCADPPVRRTVASVSGLYPSASAGLSLEFARRLAIVFHGGRLHLGVSGGTMPTAIGGKQESPHWYGAAGASLTLGFGATR
jgi:hypothetical protein